MTTDQIKQALKEPSYNFLRNNPHLGENVILLAVGGSHAYGMDTPTSDIDIRGIALNTKEEILLGENWESVVDVDTDTTIYSFNKIIDLLTQCNPNTIEILGCKPEHYLYIHPFIGSMLFWHKKAFLSQRCIFTFGGYAEAQLRRLENKSARLTSQTEYEHHILRSIENAEYDFRTRYGFYPQDAICLYIEETGRTDMDSEIFMDLNLHHYPLRDWAGMWNEMKSIVSGYNKIGKRNQKAIEHNKLGKHMAHTLRLYMMVMDILTKQEIITYREDEHDLLMAVRNGEYLDENKQPTKEFYKIVDEYSKKFDEAKKTTTLPELPDYKRINYVKTFVNGSVVANKWKNYEWEFVPDHYIS